MRINVVALAGAVLVAVSAPAMAQRQPFERAIDVSGQSALDVSTIRGKIDVRGGAPGKIVVSGLVTIRVGWDVPADAVEIMRRVAEHPPIEIDGNTFACVHRQMTSRAARSPSATRCRSRRTQRCWH